MKHKILWCGLALLLFLSGCETTLEPDVSDSALQENASTAPEGEENESYEPVTLDTLLSELYAAVPGTAGCSLKAAYAAGELLDYSWSWQSEAGELREQVSRWVEENVPMEGAIDLVYAYDAVLTQADALLAEDPGALALLEDAGYRQKRDFYEKESFVSVCEELTPLFTQIFDRVTSTPYQEEPSGSYSAITPDRFEGLWLNSECETLLIFNNSLCRVVYPALSLWGETANAYHVRDRSSMGYCPALEIDFRGEGPINESGDFYAPIAYYVSGMDDSHFWCNGQGERFDRIDTIGMV